MNLTGATLAARRRLGRAERSTSPLGLRSAAALLLLSACSDGGPVSGDACPPDPNRDVILTVERLPLAPMDGREIRERGTAKLMAVSGGYEIEVGVLRVDLLAPELQIGAAPWVEIVHDGVRLGVSTTLRIFGLDHTTQALVAWNLSSRDPPDGLPIPLTYAGDGCAGESACFESLAASLTSTPTGARIAAGTEGRVEGVRVVNGLSAFAVGGTSCLDQPGATVRGMIVVR